MKSRLTFLMIAVITVPGFLYAASDSSSSIGTLKLPENVTIELISPEHGTLTFDKGPVQLPRGNYRLESWTLVKKDESGHTWKLSGDLNTARNVEIDTDPLTLEIQTEPIQVELRINASDQSMNFTLGLNGPSGENLRVWGDAPGIKPNQLPQPTFIIYNEDESFKKSYHFQSQCCGNYRFNWTPPADAKGPFFVDLQVAGPFKIDFEARNISEIHKAKIAEQQTRQKRRIQMTYIIGACYVAAIIIIVVILAAFREPIAAVMKKGEGTFFIRPLALVLAVFVLLMLLDPLTLLISRKAEMGQAVFQGGVLAIVLFVGAAVVWVIRKVPVKWPFVTILLYGVIFIFLVIPVITSLLVAFGQPEFDFESDGLADFYGSFLTFDEPAVLIAWGILLLLLVIQLSLLIVPIRIKHRRPKPQRGIWLTAAIAGILYTLLLFTAGLSIISAIWGDNPNETVFWILVGVLPLNWIVWSVVFCLFSRSMEPRCYIRRLMNWLISGSILELLIAVPSHIIIRHRDVCCAHGFTALGLTTGIAVMFFAFGPGLYFLYADRIRSKQPNCPSQPPESAPETPPQ